MAEKIPRPGTAYRRVYDTLHERLCGAECAESYGDVCQDMQAAWNDPGAVWSVDTMKLIAIEMYEYWAGDPSVVGLDAVPLSNRPPDGEDHDTLEGRNLVGELGYFVTGAGDTQIVGLRIDPAYQLTVTDKMLLSVHRHNYRIKVKIEWDGER